MGSFSDYLENALLNHVFGTGGAHTQTYTQPDKFIALTTSGIIDADTGSSLAEPTSPSYARKQCDTWDNSTAGATQNSGPITFAQASADWGTILDFAICDSSSASNILAYGSLTTSKSVQSGDTPKFATGDLDITLG